MTRSIRQQLLATTIFCGAVIAAPAYAQAQDPPAQATNAPSSGSSMEQSSTAAPEANSQAAPVPVTNDNSGRQDDIVVTGTLLTRTRSETASPVTQLNAEALARRGLIGPADAIRSISSDNSGSIPIAFSAGFANGAAGVSLRGLTVNSTLVVFDGLRAAYYPLPDDGQRSFVDINTIPGITIDRIEVLRDGASSTYGADAIGGVVNIITKKSYQGLEASAEAGISQRGDAGEQRLTILAGTGDLEAHGWNAYIGAEYYHADPLFAKERGFPFNTLDYSSLQCAGNVACADTSPGATTAGSTNSAVVRRANQPDPNNPYNPLNTGFGPFQVLNPAGCAPQTVPHTNGNGSFCEQDVTNQYTELQPRQDRFGVSGRLSFRAGGDLEGYLSGTFYQSKVSTEGIPVALRQASPFNSTTTVLPVYICAAGVNCATAADRRLNPNDPYAAQGLAAQIYYRFGDIDQVVATTSRTYRGAANLHGHFAKDWTFALDLTGMHTDLDRLYRGYPNIAALQQAINTGSYNFVNPELNSPALLHTIAPDVQTPASTDLYMAQASVAGQLAELPGGPLQLGLGVSARYEATKDPSQNPGPPFVTLRINNYNGSGHRYVEAANFELDVPVVRQFDVNLSGRYDHYSDGFGHFSPKIAAKFTPIRQLALRGTYSKGFRAPQFFETTGTVVGFSTQSPASFQLVCTQHGGTYTVASKTCAGGDAYINPLQPIGFNSAGNPNLKPETSQSYTAGGVFQPVRWLSMTVDYYHIKKNNVITGGPLSNNAITAYYTGAALPPGYTVNLNGPDSQFPNGIQTIAQVNAPYENAASLVTDGLDVTASLRARLSPSVRFSSEFEVTDIFRFDFTPAAGQPVQHYVGTQGPYNLSSGAGTPKWRANWSNSLDVGRATLTATAYYTSGYWETAEDITGAGTAHNCADGLFDPAYCKVKHYVQVDLVGSYKVNDRFTIYMNMINAFDAKPPVDYADYAAVNYNPTWSQGGLIGRFVRVGAKVKF